MQIYWYSGNPWHVLLGLWKWVQNCSVVVLFLTLSPSHSFLGCSRNMYSYCLKPKIASPLMLNFKYKFLDSILISRLSPWFFQNSQVFGFILLQFQQSRFWLQMDTVAAGWHRGSLCPKLLQPNSTAASCCCWSRLEGWVEKHLLQQVSYGASWRGKAAAGTVRAQLHKLHAAPARSTVAVLEPAEPSCKRNIARRGKCFRKCFYHYTIPCASAYSKLFACTSTCHWTMPSPNPTELQWPPYKQPVTSYPLLPWNPPYLVPQEKANHAFYFLSHSQPKYSYK